MLDTTPLVQALIGLCGAAITALVLPWLRARLGEARCQLLRELAQVAAASAEQLYSGSGRGPEKLDFALEQVKTSLSSLRLTFDETAVRVAIEAAVFGLFAKKA